jgi:pyruvate/2-oxoglutarate dehydrogenase complex dihydrolipoamide dehydrogenase (E3) component
MDDLKFDLIVIGGGAGGFVATKLARGLGKKVAIVERERLGGECTWTGCVPSKALIDAAHKKMPRESVMQHVRKIREQVYNSHRPESFEKVGIKIFSGTPKFVDAQAIIIGEKRLHAKKFIISTGSSPFLPPIEGLEKIQYLTNKNLFDLKELPKSLIILGGGPIGVEISSAMSKLGVAVKIIEMNKNVLAREDVELAQLLQERLQKSGVEIYTNTKLVKIKKEGDGILATCESDDGKIIEINGEKLLVATGRKPNIEGLGLENIGVAYDRRGIKTNKNLQTTVKNIYASGDVVGPYRFSHMAEYQAIIATRNAFFPIKKKVNYKNVLWVTFCDPEFASCGMNETQAREKYGKKVHVYKVEYKTIDRAATDSCDFGVAKFVCDKKGNLLGANILGPRAGEIIHEVQLGKTYNIKFSKFDDIIHAYPTYCDVIKKAARMCRVDILQRNIFVKLIRLVLGSKK